MSIKTHHSIAFAQVLLSAVFLIGYFYMLYLFVTGGVNTPIVWKDTLAALISVLTAGVITILAFWFNRGRHGMEIDTEGSLNRIQTYGQPMFTQGGTCPNCGSSPRVSARAGSVREGKEQS